MKASDPYNLQRFLDPQERWIDIACQELQEGQKRSHWMWFIFPQLAGLGHSAMANLYAISSTSEAATYLAHPILGARLRQCTSLVMALDGRSVEQIFGEPDDLKFRSCMTLFSHVDSESAVFKNALRKYFAGKSDQLTLDRLQSEPEGTNNEDEATT
jgi:uncharacterized protein (DUF1810 family)